MAKSCSITAIAWWNPNTNSWEPSVPHMLVNPDGQTIGTRVRLTNTGNETFNMDCYFDHYAPNGLFECQQFGGNGEWTPGNVYDCDCIWPGGWYEGTWYMTVEVRNADTGAVLGLASFNEAIIVNQLPYAGRIEEVDWRPVGGAWAAIDSLNPPALAQGAEIELAVVFRDMGTESLYWHLEFIVTVPGGDIRSFTYTPPDLPPSPPGVPSIYPLSPGSGLQIAFNERLLLDKVGVYSAHITLKKED